jgi:hypothetical protein
VVIVAGGADLWLVLLVVLCVTAAVGRGLIVREDLRESQGRVRRADGRGDRLKLRSPRDLAIVVVAVVLGAASFIILLAHRVHF